MRNKNPMPQQGREGGYNYKFTVVNNTHDYHSCCYRHHHPTTFNIDNVPKQLQ